MKKIIIFVIVTLILTFFLSIVYIYISSEPTHFFYSTKINKTEKVSVENLNNINIKTVSAEVNFYVVDDDEIKANYSGLLNCLFCDPDYKFTFDVVDDTLNIKTMAKSKGIYFNFNSRLNVYLPRKFQDNIVINSTSSDINIDDLNISNLEIKTVSGEIEIENIEIKNKLILNTTSGDIELDNVKADIIFNVTSGDIEAENIIGNIKGKTTSGEIELEIIGDEFEIDIECVSGDIEIDLLNNNFSFIIETISGDIDIDYKYTVNVSKDNYIDGVVGDGGNSINIKTISGDVSIS